MPSATLTTHLGLEKGDLQSLVDLINALSPWSNLFFAPSFYSLRKLRRPYELAKFIAFWSLVTIVALWTLYYLSVGIYLSFYYFVLRPPAVVSVSQPLNLRYPDPDVRDYVYAYHCVAPITYPQAYRWKLSLELPDNPTNLDAGVFMVSLALYPPNKLPTQPPEEVRAMFYRHLQSNVGNPSVELEPSESHMRVGSRPLMLRWRPAVYRVIQTIVYAFPRLVADVLGLGWFDETQVLETHLIERQITHSNSTSRSKQCFVVSINNPNVQIYRATIEATVLLEGWRYLLYYWFWTCLLVGSFIIFGLLVFGISTYMAVRMLIGLLRGDVKFPKLWLTDEEEKMQDMKRAVSSLLLEKRRQSQSNLDLTPILHSPRKGVKSELKASSVSLAAEPSSSPGSPPSPPIFDLPFGLNDPPLTPVVVHHQPTRFASLFDISLPSPPASSSASPKIREDIDMPTLEDTLPIGDPLLPTLDPLLPSLSSLLPSSSENDFDDLDWNAMDERERMRRHKRDDSEGSAGSFLNPSPRINRFERIDESRIASSSGALPTVPLKASSSSQAEVLEAIRPLLEDDTPPVARKRSAEQDVEPKDDLDPLL